MPAKRTIHIVQKLAPGGIETLVLDLLRTGEPGDKVYSLDGEAEALITAWPALRAVRGRLVAFEHGGGLSPLLVSRLVRRLHLDRPTSVVVHHIGPYLYGGLASRLARVPTLVHVEHDGWHLASPRHRWLTRTLEWLLRPRHVAVSTAVARSIGNILPGTPVRVIGNGLDLGRFVPGDKMAARRRLGLPLTARIVGSVGRLTPVKGHDVLLRAAVELPDDVHVVIVGHGQEHAALFAVAAEAGIVDRVHMLGHRDDIDAVLPAFDVFCLPSRSEGLPRSVVEAQACGIPVVATDVGGVREAMCPETSALVPPESPAALASALMRVLSAPKQCTPRSFVEQRFAWADTVAGYAEMTGAPHAA